MLKSKFIRRRQSSKSTDKQPTVASENLIEPPEQFGNGKVEEGNTDSTTADNTMKLFKRSEKKGKS